MQSTGTRSLAEGALEVASLEDLSWILDPTVNLVTWRRPELAGVAAVAGAMSGEVGKYSRLILRCGEEDLVEAVGSLLPEPALELDPGAAALWTEDIVHLCEAFADLVQAEDLMISLEGPAEATCPRFHVDRVGIRMLVTYAGPGSEWLAEADVDRRWLGEAGQGLPDEENGVIREGGSARTVEPFSVTLLKGEAWPGADGFGAVHRSPDPAGAPRLLLRVDMLSQAQVDQ